MKIIPLITAFFLISIFVPRNTQAQCSAQNENSDKIYPCVLCRTGNAEDYQHFAYNQFYGSLSWMNTSEAALFYVQNASGEIVGIDMDMQYTGLGLPVPWLTWNGDSIAIPLRITGAELQIKVIFANGDQPYVNINPEYVPDYFPIDGQTPGGIGAEDEICDEDTEEEESADEDNDESPEDQDPPSGKDDEGFSSGDDRFSGGGAGGGGGGGWGGSLTIPDSWNPPPDSTCGISTVDGDDSTATTTCR